MLHFLFDFAPIASNFANQAFWRKIAQFVWSWYLAEQNIPSFILYCYNSTDALAPSAPSASSVSSATSGQASAVGSQAPEHPCICLCILVCLFHCEETVSHLNSVLLSLSEQYSGCSWTFSLICRTWVTRRISICVVFLLTCSQECQYWKRTKGVRCWVVATTFTAWFAQTSWFIRWMQLQWSSLNNTC